MTAQPEILFAHVAQCCFIKLRGELRYTHATGIDDLISQITQQQIPCNQLVIDLNQAQFMDSTYIGLLASLARFCRQQQLPKPTLFSTNVEINSLLYGLCLEQAFTIIEQATDAPLALDKAHVITEKAYTEQQQGVMILNAHQALIDLNDKNKAAFQPVVDLLKQQLS